MTYYGVQIEPQFGYNFEEIQKIVQAAEIHDFTHAWFSDHFMLTGESKDVNAYECFTSMMAAASHTTKLRLGSLVYCNSYRYPAVLAKQIASLDHYSKGRIDFGYGAGWKEVSIKKGFSAVPFPTKLSKSGSKSEVINISFIESRFGFSFNCINDEEVLIRAKKNIENIKHIRKVVFDINF